MLSEAAILSFCRCVNKAFHNLFLWFQFVIHPVLMKQFLNCQTLTRQIYCVSCKVIHGDILIPVILVKTKAAQCEH